MLREEATGGGRFVGIFLRFKKHSSILSLDTIKKKKTKTHNPQKPHKIGPWHYSSAAALANTSGSAQFDDNPDKTTTRASLSVLHRNIMLRARLKTLHLGPRNQITQNEEEMGVKASAAGKGM